MENIQNVKKVWQAIDDIKKVIKGKDESLNKLMCTMLAGYSRCRKDNAGAGILKSIVLKTKAYAVYTRRASV